MYTRKLVLLVLVLVISKGITAQWSTDFINYQKSFPKVNQAFHKRMDSVLLQCNQKGIGWPLQEVYFRCFKLDKVMEVWVKDGIQPKFQLLKTYKVCGMSGKPGPKRKEGDRQIPEGFYYINQFNPNSNYHLSLGINYPNISDKILADAVKPGGDIFIHGDCVSVGCLAITDEQIEDVYILSAIAKSAGQEYIPVHIFPGNFSIPSSRIKIQKLALDNADYVPFIRSMQSVFYQFEKDRELPAILVNSKGQYVVQDVEIPVEMSKPSVLPLKKINTHKSRTYGANELTNNVTVFPVFEGGNNAYLDFVKNLTDELVIYLDENQKKAFVYIEYIVNVDGTISNVAVQKGGNSTLNEVLISRLENTSNWVPALKEGKSVACKMTQTLFIESNDSGPAGK